MIGKTAAELYEESKEALLEFVRNCGRTYGLTRPDDRISEMHMAFMEMYKTWKPEMGSFVASVRQATKLRMRRNWRAKQHRDGVLHRQEVPLEGIIAPTPHINDMGFLGLLSKKDKYVVKLALECDPLEAVIARKKHSERRPYRKARNMLIALLREKGWGRIRINSAFARIREAMSM